MSQATVSPQLHHFLDLARVGRANPCASSGEIQAARLAQAIVEYVPGLDGSACTGLCEFVHHAVSNPEAARRFLFDGQWPWE